MVNREGNYNRQKVRRAKLIRDKKKSRIKNKKKRVEYEEENTTTLTKKQEKKQKRINKVLKEMGMNDTNLLQKKHFKRRNKNRNREIQDNNMQIDL
jgi:hypothetical protein